MNGLDLIDKRWCETPPLILWRRKNSICISYFQMLNSVHRCSARYGLGGVAIQWESGAYLRNAWAVPATVSGKFRFTTSLA